MSAAGEAARAGVLFIAEPVPPLEIAFELVTLLDLRRRMTAAELGAFIKLGEVWDTEIGRGRGHMIEASGAQVTDL